MNDEKLLWEGHPSQILNFKGYFLFALWVTALIAGYGFFADAPVVVQNRGLVPLGLGALLGIPLLRILWAWLQIRTTRYELTCQRFRTKCGVFSRDMDELELYRVKDYHIEQPFNLRLFGLSNIVLNTSDKSHPTVVIRAVRNADAIRDQIRGCVEDLRDKKRVREVDYE